MITNDLLHELRFKGEGPDLDFKRAQYPFSGATDHQKSKLLKDILAIANSYRSGPGYILIGFEDQAPEPAKVVGIGVEDHLDDAALQQFVHGKVTPPLEFQYVERIFEGQRVAVIVIPKQARPFSATKDYGQVTKNAVYVRRGSSNAEASPQEVARMGGNDATERRFPNIRLLFHSPNNQPLPHSFDRQFLEFGEFPDYEPVRSPTALLGRSLLHVNEDYWREYAEYLASISRVIIVRLVLENLSEFALSEVKLEVSCRTPEKRYMAFERVDDLPDEPDPEASSLLRGIGGAVLRPRPRMSIDDRRDEPICDVALGTLRPGEVGRMEEDLALLPSGPGIYSLHVRILANELSPPIVVERELDIAGTEGEMTFSDLKTQVSP